MKKKEDPIEGGRGKGLQSNNFFVVNYLICIPCIGTLYFSALSVSALIRLQEMECQYKTVVLAITLKSFLVFLNFV